MEYYLGLDCEGTTIKAALFTADGKEAGVARSDTALITPRPDFIECDMEEMWKTICFLIQKVLAKSGVSNTEIAGVGICGQGRRGAGKARSELFYDNGSADRLSVFGQPFFSTFSARPCAGFKTGGV